MKIKATRKDIRLLYKNVFQCGYCELQEIMNGVEPRFYNSGVYGWNWDCYTNSILDIAITTGYRNTTGKEISADLIRKYRDNAENIWKDYRNRVINWDTLCEKIDENRNAFYMDLIK